MRKKYRRTIIDGVIISTLVLVGTMEVGLGDFNLLILEWEVRDGQRNESERVPSAMRFFMTGFKSEAHY